MAYVMAPPICSRDDMDTPSCVDLPFTIELATAPGEELVGFTAVTEPCHRHDGHVMITGWLVVSTSALSWLDNDGICYRQRVLHPIPEGE